MNDYRKSLIDEYVRARLIVGDWDEEVEAMPDAWRHRHFLNLAESLTNDQLIRACNNYALAE